MKARVIGIALVVLAIFVPFIARAEHADLLDADDTRETLDIRLANVHHTPDMKFKVATYETWTPKETWDKGYVLVHLDTFGSQGFDYYAMVNSFGTGYSARLWKTNGNSADEELGELFFKKTTRKSVTITIPLDMLFFGPNRVTYRWYTQTIFNGRVCQRPCFDLAPDEDAVVEPLPSPSPSPSSSPSPGLTILPSP